MKKTKKNKLYKQPPIDKKAAKKRPTENNTTYAVTHKNASNETQ